MTKQFSPSGGYSDADIEDESNAFMDAVRNGLDDQTKRIVRIIDNRFRSHARRMTRMEKQLASIHTLVGEVRAVKRLLMALPTIAAVLGGLAKALGWV